MWLGKSANTMEVVASWENHQTVAGGFSSLPRLITEGKKVVFDHPRREFKKTVNGLFDI